MNATRHAKNLLKDAFPSIWLHWHLMHRPKSAERELSYLGKVVSPDAVTVDVGANCGLYTRRLARLSRRVHAFEPSQQMARLLRRTSASNVSVHEIALSDHAGEADLFIPQSENGLVHGLASLEPGVNSPGEQVVSNHVPVARLDSDVKSCPCGVRASHRYDGEVIERAERRHEELAVHRGTVEQASVEVSANRRGVDDDLRVRRGEKSSIETRRE